MGKGMGDLARVKSFDESEKDEMYRASLKKNVHFHKDGEDGEFSELLVL